MKKRRNLLLPALLFPFCFLMSYSGISEVFKAESYTEVEISKLKATPEEYKNKKVTFKTAYESYGTTFLPYMEKSGFKAGKDYYIRAAPENLPVMAEKTKEMNEIIPVIKRGATVKLYGKIKKFSSSPDATVLPHYYLELDKIEIIEAAPKDSKEQEREKRRENRPGRFIGPPTSPTE